MTDQPKYFVAKWGILYAYSVYKIASWNHFADRQNLVYWQGNSFAEARRQVKEANRPGQDIPVLPKLVNPNKTTTDKLARWIKTCKGDKI